MTRPAFRLDGPCLVRQTLEFRRSQGSGPCCVTRGLPRGAEFSLRHTGMIRNLIRDHNFGQSSANCGKCLDNRTEFTNKEYRRKIYEHDWNLDLSLLDLRPPLDRAGRVDPEVPAFVGLCAPGGEGAETVAGRGLRVDRQEEPRSWRRAGPEVPPRAAGLTLLGGKVSDSGFGVEPPGWPAQRPRNFGLAHSWGGRWRDPEISRPPSRRPGDDSARGPRPWISCLTLLGGKASGWDPGRGPRAESLDAQDLRLDIEDPVRGLVFVLPGGKVRHRSRAGSSMSRNRGRPPDQGQPR